jgi:hypothetical protein
MGSESYRSAIWPGGVICVRFQGRGDLHSGRIKGLSTVRWAWPSLPPLYTSNPLGTDSGEGGAFLLISSDVGETICQHRCVSKMNYLPHVSVGQRRRALIWVM